jgi:hypothetical protein
VSDGECIKTLQIHVESLLEASEMWHSRTCTRRVRPPCNQTWHCRPFLTYTRGGVRGIVELEILRQLETELGDMINIQSFFDLIIGTSTGGIVALGLTARNW